MRASTPDALASQTRTAAATRARALPIYRLYGLNVRSELSLPIPPEAEADDTVIDVFVRRVRRGESSPIPDGPAVAGTPCTLHGLDGLVYRGEGGIWIWNRSTATYHIQPDGRRIDVYPEPGADERTLALPLIGQVALALLHQRGSASLHASAIVTRRGAVVFLGPQGQGKSTMAAAFLRRGAALVTDDALPLRLQAGRIAAVPSMPLMKVWRPTAEQGLGVSEKLPLIAADSDKRLLALAGRFAFARDAVSVHALYLLERYDPGARGSTNCESVPLHGRAALAVLLGQTSQSGLLNAAEQARLLPLYARLLTQAPLRVLRYPNGFAHQERICSRIMQDLEGR